MKAKSGVSEEAELLRSLRPLQKRRRLDGSESGRQKRRKEEARARGSEAPKVAEDEDGAFAGLLAAAQALESQIRALDQLPLAVASFSFIGPEFRSTAVRPPTRVSVYKDSAASLHNGAQIPTPPHPLLQCPSYRVLVALEQSGKWPKEEDGIRHCGTAFLAEIAKGLQDNFHVHSLVYPDRLVINASGFPISLEISQERLLGNLERELREFDGDEKGKKELRERVDKLTLETTLRPKLSRFLKNEVGTRAHFAATVRLAKRWVWTQMLGGHVDSEVVETLVAALPRPFASAAAGFRAFLDLLSTHDFLRHPVVANFNDTLTPKELEESRRRMVEERPRLPWLVLLSPVDADGWRWTRARPDPPTLAALRRRAAEALQRPRLSATHPPATGHFHLRLLLHPQPKAQPALLTTSTKVLPPPDMNPHCTFVDALNATFGHLAVFFWDAFGGREVGVIWKPAAISSTKPGIKNVNGRLLDVDDEGKEILTLNAAAVIEDMRMLGKGVVSDVVIQKVF